ncbi:MAG: tetratricopeptide repeat protein [Pirellulales bacterium]
MIRLTAALVLATLLLPGSGPSQSLRAAGPIELDDVPAPLNQDEPRSEAHRDRLDAVSMFAAGRMLEQRQELPQALRRYQRAFRLDPTAEPVLREIVPLAFNLGREEEAVRYATKLAELDASDPMLLRRLGIVLTEQRQFKDALALYEKVRKLEAGKPKSAGQVMLHLEMGRLYLLTEQYDKAAELFAFVSKSLDAPDDYGLTPVVLKSLIGDKGELHELMAAGFLETGNVDEAARSFSRLEKLSSNKAVAAYNQARIAAQAGRHDEALARLEDYFAARESSKAAAPYELFAKLLRQKQQAAELIPRLEKLLAEQAGNVPLNFALAEEYFQNKELEKAESRYQVVLASQPSAEVYRRLLEIYSRSAQHEKLIRLLAEIVAKSGSLEIVETQLESLAADKSRSEGLLKLAQEKFGEAKPEHHDVLEAAALVALEAKSYDTAGELFELAIKAKPADKAQLLLRFGLELFLAEKFSEAARIFQRGIDEKALPQSNPAFYFYLAGALAMDGKTDEALAAARTAAEKKSDDPRFESRVAWIYYHAKRYDEAVESYRALLKKYDTNYDSSDVRSVVHDTRLILSNIAVLQEKLAEAEEWIEQVLDEFPDDTGALNDLGYLWADQNKRLQRAQRMIRRAVEAEPDNAAYRDSLGWVLYRLGEYQAAAVEQKKAVELSKSKERESDGVMYDHLGDIHAALGQTDEAAAAWREAATAFEKAGEKDKLEVVKKKLE